MRKQRVIPVLLGLVFGCALAVDAQTINLGQTVNGTLASTDGRSAACTGCFADNYQLTVPAGSAQVVFITLSSSVFDTTLRLYDSSGRLLRENDDDVRGTTTGNSFIGALLNSGTYRIEASSYTPGDSGAYTLATQGTIANLRSISTGQTLTGNLSTASGGSIFGDGSPADLYQFTVTTSQLLVITMSSAQLDSFMYLMDSSGVILADDDDSGGNGDAQIARVLAPGTYRVEAGTFVGESGSYSLSLQASTPVVTNIAVGQTVNGSLSSADGRSVGCSGCFADVYQFSLTSSQTLAITLSSAAFDTYLRILDSQGQTIAENDDDTGTNSFFQQTFAPGTYRIEASSYDNGVSGAYTLSLVAVTIQTLPITVGQTVNGTLRNTAARSSGCTGCYADIYQFSVTSSQTLRILMTSTVFDTFLRVLDSSNQEVATNDDGGGGSNSLIGRTFAPGTYRIEATSYGEGETGAYTLALTTVTQTVSPISVGATATTVNSSLSATSGSSVGCSACFANIYQFTLTSSQTVDIRLSSTVYDTYLRVLDSGGVAVAEDDDGGGGTNSNIRRIFAAGTYRIEATSYGAGETGAFSLTVQIVTVTVTPIAVGSSVNGNLTVNASRSAGCSGCYADIYQFTAGVQQLVISMNSTAFDAYLRVIDSSGNAVATDDDSGGDTNPRINRTFAAGTYRIEATSYSSGKSGAYTLSVTTASSTQVPPVLTSLSPGSAQAGTAAFVLLVNGSGFNSGTVVQWAGSNRSTTVISATQLQASIPASDLATAREVSVTATTGIAGSNSLKFNVTSSAPTLTASPDLLQFTGIENQTGIAAQAITVGGNVGWTAAVRTASGGNWLLVSPSSGSGPGTVRVSVNSNLAAGTYSGSITLQSTTAGLSRAVLVTLVLSRAVPILQPTQTGFLFQGVEGQSIPPQTFQVRNGGSGTMNWSISAQTSDGKPWLSVSPASGTSPAGASAVVPTVTIRVDSSQLKPGSSVGTLTLVTTGAPGAPNSPQALFVLASLTAAGSDPIFSVQPAGLVFTATVGGSSPPPRELTISASGGTALTYTASVATTGSTWLSVLPATGSLTAGRAAVSVRANIGGLTRGTYTGTVSITLSTGVRQDLAVVLNVSAATVAAQGTGPQAECVPTRLSLVETQLAGNFSISVSWPVSLRTFVVNDCNQPVTDATVIATFNTGDPPLSLNSLRDGNYTGNWIPSKPDRTVVTIRATAAGLTAQPITLDGKVAASAAALPTVARNATLNAASFKQFEPVAPGSLVSVFGTNLGTSTAGAATLPLPMTLADVRAQLGGKDVPLVFANSGQVNAQIPTDLAPGTQAALVVTVRGVAAVPDQITLAANQPGIFSINSSGAGQGAIQVANTVIFAAPAGSIPGAQARPVHRGEFITIYCTGLGATNPTVASGQPAVGAPRATIPVTVTIGGVTVPADFAGLSPGFVGLYQVNIPVPAGVLPGSAVQLFLTQGGVTSNTVTIAVD